MGFNSQGDESLALQRKGSSGISDQEEAKINVRKLFT